MNAAHFHLLVNHFPIFTLLFGTIIGIIGYFKKNTTLDFTAYALFVVAAITTFLAMQSGEGAEEIAEQLNISHDIIHHHEEWAEKMAILTYLTGATAVLAFITKIKGHNKALFFARLVLLFALAATALTKFVGTSGGEIRHTEIRK